MIERQPLEKKLILTNEDLEAEFQRMCLEENITTNYDKKNLKKKLKRKMKKNRKKAQKKTGGAPQQT